MGGERRAKEGKGGQRRAKEGKGGERGRLTIPEGVEEDGDRRHYRLVEQVARREAHPAVVEPSTRRTGPIRERCTPQIRTVCEGAISFFLSKLLRMNHRLSLDSEKALSP